MSKKRHITPLFPADRLPAEVLGSIDPRHDVTVIVEDRTPASTLPIERFRKYFGARKEYQTSVSEAVDRVRRLRDEWD